MRDYQPPTLNAHRHGRSRPSDGGGTLPSPRFAFAYRERRGRRLLCGSLLSRRRKYANTRRKSVPSSYSSSLILLPRGLAVIRFTTARKRGNYKFAFLEHLEHEIFVVQTDSIVTRFRAIVNGEARGPLQRRHSDVPLSPFIVSRYVVMSRSH